MGKKLKVHRLDLGSKNLVELHSKSLNKHGVLKGKNKKETKVLKATCMHHKYNKKGKLKSRISDVDKNGICHCTMCETDFRALPYNKEDRRKALDESLNLIDNTKFYITAVDPKNEAAQRLLAEADVAMRLVAKYNKKVTKIVMKKDNLTEKKKKNEVESTLGSWSTKRK